MLPNPILCPVRSKPRPTPQGGRRGLLVAAVAAGACAGRCRGLVATQPRRSRKSADATGDPFWALRWETPDGNPLAMASSRGVHLLNFLGNLVCAVRGRAFLPMLNDFYRQNRADGWQVLALAVDRPEPVRGFCDKCPGFSGRHGSHGRRRFGAHLGQCRRTPVFGCRR